ncbi:peptidase M48 [Salipiger sp. IMCC34102]|uniref:M48 family metalloprotease n=1 Tax=Salipiger sp. IMCC34102 TaxID=2510647 RepID=UPI00101BBB35|nr:M48 family metalloprotease [Salipiger sp. IMCC34102]RYH01902.1 peptidase M48 [Salipiger sp. IMCC34102]
MLRSCLAAVLALGLAACAAPDVVVPDDPAIEFQARSAAQRIVEVTPRVEATAEAVCAERAPQLNCDFEFLIDTNPRAAPNAYQTAAPDGQPLIVITAPLIVEARNEDELAFILSHEAAHHIEGHIARQRINARMGAAIMGQKAGLAPDRRSLRDAVAFGAAVGARTYAKEFELEADRLGTFIAARAGYDPLRGAEFFFRIPDPGNVFLGTHPPNADRLRAVAGTAAALGR